MIIILLALIQIILPPSNPEIVYIDEPVQLSVLANQIPGDEITFRWSFTDLPNIAHIHFNVGSQEPDTVIVKWKTTGIKTVTVMVQDELGNTGQVSFEVQVKTKIYLPIVIKER